jgi:hypothetical protein
VTHPSRDELISDARSCADDLTEPYRHAEPFVVWRTDSRGRKRRRIRLHHTEHPCLLDQLADAIDPTFRQSGGSPIGAKTPASGEPISVAASAALGFITDAVTRWRDRLNISDDGRHRWFTLHGDVRRLAAEAARLDRDRLARLAADLCLWRGVARHYCGWDRRPWTPDVRCPRCARLPGDRSGLRVWLDRRFARCLSCGVEWDGAAPLAQLGRMIAHEHADSAG